MRLVRPWICRTFSEDGFERREQVSGRLDFPPQYSNGPAARTLRRDRASRLFRDAFLTDTGTLVSRE